MIIGLGYKARSGKDTAGKVLVSRYGFRRVAFADRLKLVASAVMGFDANQLYGDAKEVEDTYWGFTPRWALQRIGEALRTHIGADVWIKALLRDPLEQGTNLVITDVRHRNEVEAIHALGGFAVRIDRDEAGANGGVAGHASECELDGFDGWDEILDNNKSLDTLPERVVELVERLRGERTTKG